MQPRLLEVVTVHGQRRQSAQVLEVSTRAEPRLRGEAAQVGAGQLQFAQLAGQGQRSPAMSDGAFRVPVVGVEHRRVPSRLEPPRTISGPLGDCRRRLQRLIGAGEVA